MTSPPGGSCAALQECTGGSLCRDGWCVCPDTNMVVSNGQCIISQRGQFAEEAETNTVRDRQPVEAYPGEFCGEYAVCNGRSICRAGQCYCPEGEEAINRQCVKMEPKIIG